MRDVTEGFDVGIIVGRFQIHALSEGHVELIQEACDRHYKVIIFLGLSPVRGTTRNPLDFEARKQMILERFPDVSVLYIKDESSNEVWSKSLDDKVTDLLSPTQTAVLYGSRDSFIPFYSGKYPTCELEPTVFTSATEVRNQLRRQVVNSADWRAGACWSAANRYPTVFTTCDVAVFNEDYTKILLGRKKNETQYRLIGGFSDPSSASFEDDARREVREEAQIEIDNLTYLGSRRVDDWRYEHEVDKITTLLYAATIAEGRPDPADDIVELIWADWSFGWQEHETPIVSAHRPLMAMLKKAKNKIQ